MYGRAPDTSDLFYKQMETPIIAVIFNLLNGYKNNSKTCAGFGENRS